MITEITIEMLDQDGGNPFVIAGEQKLASLKIEQIWSEMIFLRNMEWTQQLILS